jgi:hypothetical protein
MKARAKPGERPMTNIKNEIRDALIDATVTFNGVEVTDYSELYLALVQSLQDTLPDGYVVEWGPRSRHNKQLIENAPSELWERACAGDLEL